MSGRSFCKPVIKVDRVPTPIPSEDTPTPSGGRFGNLRAKRESIMESPLPSPSSSSIEGGRFANLKSNASVASLASMMCDSPVEESRFTRLRSRPSEGSFPVDAESQEPGRFGLLKSTSTTTFISSIEEIVEIEGSRFSGIVKSSSYSAFEMRRERKPSEEHSKRLIVNESSNFILRKIAERQNRDEPSGIASVPRILRNSLAEMVTIAQNTIETPPLPKPKKVVTQTKKSMKRNVSLDDLDDEIPPTLNAAKIAAEYGLIEESDSDSDTDEQNNLSNKQLKKLRRLEKITARGGPSSGYI